MTRLRDELSFGFEQTFTIEDWWQEPGFVSTSDTPLKRQKMLECALEIAAVLGGEVKESVDVWGHIQFEVIQHHRTHFYVTMDPGSIEVKTHPCLIDHIEELNAPMFEGARRAGLVTYRKWWYGVKGGTEGGCHVNMGGLTLKTNPLLKNPMLVARYFAWLHNHPEFHYPFMGPDTGPGGNAQRMDEVDAPNALEPLAQILQLPTVSAEELRERLKETSLVKEKSSMPSLTKFKGPDYLLEDRGQEAPYDARELRLVAEWRLRVLEELEQTFEAPQVFEPGHWHGERLSSVALWDRFWVNAQALGLNPQDYRVFFDRQFPLLLMGNNLIPEVQLREGRRPRVITDVKKRGDTVISKTIDTRHKRFEIFVPSDEWGVEYAHKKLAMNWLPFGSGRYGILDLLVEDPDAILHVHLGASHARFSPQNMTWV